MFGRQRKQNLSSPQLKPDIIGSDLIVHNMPRSPQFNSGVTSTLKINQSSGGLVDLNSKFNKDNSKIIGVLIIVGGLFLVAIIIYFSYRMIIAPALIDSSPKSQNLNSEIASDVNQIVSQAPIIATSSPIASGSEITAVTISEASTTSIDLETLVASSSDINKISGAPLVDTDGDGLLDIEEVLIGSSPLSADSDGDSYDDLAELTDGYDPVATGGINNNPNLITYFNEQIGYKFIYPKGWELASAQDGNLITISTGDDSLIQILTTENLETSSIINWYEASFADDPLSYERLQNTTTWEGVKSADGLNLYLTDKLRRQILVVSYISAGDGPIKYNNLFKMIIKSLSFE